MDTRDDAEVDSRVTLALERTLLAWTRTALALMGFGFVFARLPFVSVAPPAERPMAAASAVALGMAMVAMGIAVQVVALVMHAKAVHRLRQGREVQLRVLSPAYIVGVVLVGAGVTMATYLAMT